MRKNQVTNLEWNIVKFYSRQADRLQKVSIKSYITAIVSYG